ncbi:MAG: Sec-dependent nitrous-oxide reductase [Myxococcota bacterium]
MTIRHARLLPLSLLIIAALGLIHGCDDDDGAREAEETKSAAEQSYVPPGELDEYYLFYSGGHGSDVRVAGLPSLRHIRTIPVFSPNASYGYGYDDESREMLGEYTWGDVHHPALSQTDGKYDGRWLFVNDNAHNRVARISLEDFETKQILGPIPNTSGNHGSSFVTSNTEYLFGGSRFSSPIPRGQAVSLDEYAESYHGVITAIEVDDENGEMQLAWQIKTPPFQWDLSSAGKGPSEGWLFVSSYNTERAHKNLEVEASQRDRDYAAFVNWRRAEQAVKDGQFEEVDGAKVIDPAEVDGVMYYVPLAKSPHGIDVDPSGRWIVGGGKLEPSVTVFDFEDFLAAVEKEDFVEREAGVPVVNPDSVVEGMVPVGQGPLHTQFDGRGHGYTTLFIDSKVAKFKLPPWDDEQSDDLESAVIDRIDVHTNPGHLVIGGSDTSEPYGKWLVSMNKQAKGRHLHTGPAIPETSQLIDITGEKMKMVAEAFTDKEPHFAQVVAADVIDPKSFTRKSDNDHPHQVWTEDEAFVRRDGKEVDVGMRAVRSNFKPDNLEFEVGDTVRFHITNIEQTLGMSHGFGIGEHDVNLEVNPGATVTATVEMEKVGVFPFYCTVFCSALHQEMQGYFVVHPEGTLTDADG